MMFKSYFFSQIVPNVDNNEAPKVRKYHAIKNCMFNKGWLSTTQIATELHMSKEGVTALLNRNFIKLGYVEKRQNPTDTRRNTPFEWRWINESKDLQATSPD